jgi:hypothetical protein
MLRIKIINENIKINVESTEHNILKLILKSVFSYPSLFSSLYRGFSYLFSVPSPSSLSLLTFISEAIFSGGDV